MIFTILGETGIGTLEHDISTQSLQTYPLKIEQVILIIFATWAKLSQDLESVTGAGSSSEGGSDIVMELGSWAAAGAGAGPGPRLAVILCGPGYIYLKA